MSTENKTITCERCGFEAKEADHNWTTSQFFNEGGGCEHDLCKSCAVDLHHWIEAGAA